MTSFFMFWFSWSRYHSSYVLIVFSYYFPLHLVVILSVKNVSDRKYSEWKLNPQSGSSSYFSSTDCCKHCPKHWITGFSPASLFLLIITFFFRPQVTGVTDRICSRISFSFF